VSPEKQRIAIAQTCGYVPHTPGAHGVLRWTHPDFGSKILYVDDLPDYLNDLNTMHEMRRVLDNGALWGGYLNRLWGVVCPQFQQMSEARAAIGLLLIHATAAERAEAFLKTLNKWEDDK